MFDLDFHGVGMHFFELPDLENGILDTKIIILAHLAKNYIFTFNDWTVDSIIIK